MITLYLRADTEADMIAALPWARAIAPAGDGVWNRSTESYALDLVGAVVTAPGVYGEDHAVITQPTLDDRFHANLRCTAEIAAQVTANIIIDAPATPARVWF
ncbi:hypothetical protein [Mesorhizobium sp. 1M-11]|uniref:hypothetical protein n=1 Tax=Mesorhizobium sp. 1M-11 TaxID=1529006 RepID=UPI0006C76F4D|nr:hypothetical protein [Mesorhizobium sp. 1M-11]